MLWTNQDIESGQHTNRQCACKWWNMKPSVKVSSSLCSARKTFTTIALSDPTHTGLMDKSEVVKHETTFRYHFQSLVKNPTCFPTWTSVTLDIEATAHFSYRKAFPTTETTLQLVLRLTPVFTRIVWLIFSKNTTFYLDDNAEIFFDHTITP